MSGFPSNVEEMRKNIQLVSGAQFWAYISPQNETSKYVTKWQVKIEQTDGSWVGVIDSEDPTKILETPHLSGIFKVTVMASGPYFDGKILDPAPDSEPDIGCSLHCAGMVGIVATKDHADAYYWTVWDALC